MERQHLILYDGTCGLCHYILRFLIHHDKQKIFVFAPLQGTTADKIMQDCPAQSRKTDSLVLIENYKDDLKRRFLFLGKGALRSCWLLGGLWTIPGSFSFLPSYFYDWAYRFVARNRQRLFEKPSCPIPSKEDSKRFLP